jgi:uncharacterized membrane protein (TIGR02234 family)
VSPAPPRRRLWTWVLACAAGTALALLPAGQTWVSVRHGQGAPVAISGGDLVPAAQALALAALAAVVAFLATKGLFRRAVGAVISLCGLGLAALTWGALTGDAALDLAARREPMAAAAAGAAAEIAFWPCLTIAGALVLAVAGVIAVARGGGWPGMSDRYEREGTARPVNQERALWEAMDRGEDPTAGTR